MEIKKGQRIKLNDLTNASQLTAELDIEMGVGAADVTCFGIDEMNKLSDDRYFVFYNQPASPSGEIQMKTIGRVTEFQLQLDRLPAQIKKLVFTVTSDADVPVSAISRGVLSLKAEGQVVALCHFDGTEFQQEKAIIMIEIYIRDGSWRISSVMSGFNGGLSALLAHFGGEEAEQPQESSAPKSADLETAPIPAVPSGPVSLKKPGDSHKISLKKEKGSNRLHVNLNWNARTGGFFGGGQNVDLDLACMFRLKDGRAAVVQALGNSFGSETEAPYIRLDHDDRSGASKGGENMFFSRPEELDFAVVFAYIYEGAANWRSTDAKIVIHQNGAPDIEIALDKSNSKERFCVIAVLENTGEGLKIRREERYFSGHVAIDNQYGFGIQWRTGRK